MNRTLDLPTIYRTLYDSVAQVMSCDILVVSRFDPATRLIHCVYYRNEEGELDVSEYPPIPLEPEGKGTQSRVIHSAQSLWMPDYEKFRGTSRTSYYVSSDGELVEQIPDDADRPRSALVTPLVLEQQVVGVIQVMSYTKNALHRSHMRLLEALALHVVTAMTNAQLYQRAQAEVAIRRAAEDALRLNEARLEALFHLNQQSFESEHVLIEFALEEAVRLTGSQIGYLHFVRADQLNLELFAWSREVMKTCQAKVDLHYPISEAGLWADSVRYRKPVVHNDYPHMAGRSQLPEGHSPIERHMSVPVVDQGRVVLVAGVANKVQPYDEADVRQLQLFGEGLWSLVVRRRAEARLRAMLDEKEVLLREVHHRVKNNLQSIISLIGLRIDRVTEAATRSFLESLQQQARTMALVYDQFSRTENLAQVDMASFIKQIARHLAERFYAEETIAMDIQAVSLADPTQPLMMNVSEAMPCGLLVNELLTNAFEHAFSQPVAQPSLKVCLEQRAGDYHLVVADNGAGLPPGFDLKNSPSLGLQLVHLWVTHQLSGQMVIHTGQGTCFEITFPRE